MAAGRSKLVGGMCSMLPYDTGICCYAFIFVIFVIASVHSFFMPFLKSGIDKLTEWSMIPRGDTKGTNSLKKIVLDVCVCFILCKFVSGLILWFLDN